MPASTIADRNSYMFDKLLSIRDLPNAAALAATTTETGILLNMAQLLGFKLVLNIAAYTGYTISTAVWGITVEVATDAAFTSPIQVYSYTTLGTAFQLDVPLSGEFITETANAGVIYIRTKATKTGAPGNLNYGAYLTQISPA